MIKYFKSQNTIIDWFYLQISIHIGFKVSHFGKNNQNSQNIVDLALKFENISKGKFSPKDFQRLSSHTYIISFIMEGYSNLYFNVEILS